jgi:hypothetical protein
MVISGCGGGSDDSSSTNTTDSKYSLSYQGLTFYTQDMPLSSYRLSRLSDGEFNALSDEEKLRVADKLLSTLFYAYPLAELKEKMASGTFISDVAAGLTKTTTDIAWLESYILDESKFYRPNGYEEVTDILSRFYSAKDLDRYFFNNWIAYILTQTIMFSPAYELDSSHAPNVARVYNRLVTLLDEEASMRFITFAHMESEDNWRRFRSPEDNGREMLEIYTLNNDDADIPIAATALQNWNLDRDNDTLVIGLNENTKPLTLFGKTIYNGDDFYRELAKSEAFRYGVVKRLVNFFFTDNTAEEIDSITDTIVSSRPETWQDILKQIIFSKEYLLHTSRAKSAEETFFSLAKKLDYKIRNNTIYYLRSNIEAMNQASMKYKLGKLTRVPLDTLSFATYAKYIREEVLLRRSNPASEDNFGSWSRQGWSDSFLAAENYESNATTPVEALHALIDYVFEATVARAASQEELAMFDSLMLRDEDGELTLLSQFNILDDREDGNGNRRGDEYKRYVARTVLDYLSRLEDVYLYKRVD